MSAQKRFCNFHSHWLYFSLHVSFDKVNAASDLLPSLSLTLTHPLTYPIDKCTAHIPPAVALCSDHTIPKIKLGRQDLSEPRVGLLKLGSFPLVGDREVGLLCPATYLYNFFYSTRHLHSTQLNLTRLFYDLRRLSYTIYTITLILNQHHFSYISCTQWLPRPLRLH